MRRNSADILIYLPPGLRRDRDEIEDAIEDALGEDGEVTGGGAGDRGSNIDVVVHDRQRVALVVPRLRSALRRLGAPAATKLVVAGVESLLG
jgi:hypothetical protein